MKFRQNLPVALILLVFGIIYCDISPLSHYLFRTAALDLGIYNNAIYDYSHFHWNNCAIMQPEYTNLLSDHFELYPVLFSPLRYISGTYTCLIIQIASILYGGLGIYLLILKMYGNRFLACLAAVHFFSIWGIFSALGYDYHNNVVAAMLLPWFFYFFFQKDLKKASVFFVLILIGKENMALWMAFVCLGLFFHFWKEKKLKIRAAGLGLISVCYFFIIMQFIMPSLTNAGRNYNHFQYSMLGNSIPEVISTIFQHP